MFRAPYTTPKVNHALILISEKGILPFETIGPNLWIGLRKERCNIQEIFYKSLQPLWCLDVIHGTILKVSQS